MRKSSFSFPWRKYISAVLVFILLFSQTVRVDFFDQAEAKADQYRDIVSILVDKPTYNQLKSKIEIYADDIQWYLGNTRVSLIVVDAGTDPARIAARNEKLYEEGDGDSGVSRLVGTILIGNIPLPMVGDNGAYFPSMYPYVDFVDKAFIYNSRSHTYETSPEASRTAIEAEIWHGVINPAVGRDWTNADIVKISSFLDKTHSFYTKSGKFATSAIPPRVFYYDGEYESQSVNLRSLVQYGLSIQNSENLAYKRFTKYLLKDINNVLSLYDSKNNTDINNAATASGFTPHGDTFDAGTIAVMPDIQTKVPIQTLLKDFQSIINKKTLSDALANVHNAGRYNSGSTVRVDISPLKMTVMDEIARTTLKESNTAMMSQIDASVSLVARKIPIFVSQTVTVANPLTTNTGNKLTTQVVNYMFGKDASEIHSVESCTIARGSSSPIESFGRSVLVEANVAYDINTTEGHVGQLTSDTSQFVGLDRNTCFNGSSVPKIGSYWGGNSMLRVIGSSNAGRILQDPLVGVSYTGISLPIFSLGGMKETKNLHALTIDDCRDTTYQYTLLQPYTYYYTVSRGDTDYQCEAGYPSEWNHTTWDCNPALYDGTTPRFTCFTKHSVGAPLSFNSVAGEYSAKKANPYGCFAGDLYLQGNLYLSVRNNTCFEAVGEGGGDTVDRTRYETTRFNSINSMLRHVSPTDEEILAAEANGMTPSLPVDMVRYIEFLTPGQYKAQINYPNFFNIPSSVIDPVTFRSWLKSLGVSEWNKVIAGNGGINNVWSDPFRPSGDMPSTPPDWNTYISDDSVNMILRARNWLNPDVTKKYKQAVETSLSYSHEYVGIASDKQPPKYPVTTSGYEIAYLGLDPFVPGSSDNPEILQLEQDYNYRMNELQGINISEPHENGDKNPYAESDKCGPPEGVSIFQWPSAIMCWMKTLLPPRIIAGSCGSNTIGLDGGSASSMIAPSVGNSSGSVGMQSFYQGGKLVYSTERTSMNYGDSLEIKFNYTKNNSRLSLPPGSTIKLEIKSLKDVAGNLVPVYSWPEYIAIAPASRETTDAGGSFLLTSKDKKATIELESTLSILLPGGVIYTPPPSDRVGVHISSDYIRIIPKKNNIGAQSVDVTEAGPITFDVQVIDEAGKESEPGYPIKLTIVDDIDGNIVYTGTVTSNPILPTSIATTVGVYRILLEDIDGHLGETTLAVTSGKLSQIVVSPVSSMIKKGSNTLAILHLQDALGNPISPDLNKVTVRVTGGYLSDVNGVKQSEMVIDAMEADIPLLIGSDTVGALTLDVTTDAGIQKTGSIQVRDDIRAIVTRTTNPQVGGVPIDVSLKIVDAGGTVLTGFNSVTSLELPEGAGSFGSSTIPIKDGVTTVFKYTPGTRAGDHKLKLDIPGIGTVSDISFSVLPGVPLYISHSETESTIDFTLNDRYGNTSTQVNTTGTLKVNTGSSNVSFVNGIYHSIPKKSGYYSMEVPSLKTSSISYTDDSGVHTATGISFYATYINGVHEKFDFLPDYNARYSVLYGNSYLREGEDILYDSYSTGSQSLAVTTLLDSPFVENTLATVLPGGKILLSTSQDNALPEASVSLQNAYPVVHIQDIVSQKSITNILYRLNGAELSVCEGGCFGALTGPALRLIPAVELGFTGSVKGNLLELTNEGTVFFSVDRLGRMTLSPGLSLHVLDNNDTDGLLLDIQSGGSSIASLILKTDSSLAVSLRESVQTAIDINTPIIEKSSSTTPKKISRSSLNAATFGYSFLNSSGIDKSLDEREIGPNGVSSFAATHDTPGIGWGGDNKTLLSYAAGDTVGEATRWFQTYTMINMGDPVAHVDHMAPGTEIEGIDRTIGTQVTSSLGAEVASYSHRDMDKDGLEDIITLDTDGYLGLYINLRSRFRYRQKIAYVPELIERGVSLGDFQHDGFADIVGLDHSGSLIYIDNSGRRLTRMDMRLTDNGVIPSGITDFKIFDMNQDKKDDIIYMSEGGELAILYGTDIARTFTRNILDSTLGVTLSANPEKIGGAFYFTGLPQIPADTFGVSSTSSTGADNSTLQSEVYYQYSERIESDPVAYTGTSDIETFSGGLNVELGSAQGSSRGSTTQTYIKSQYAEAYDTEITRTFKKVDSSPILHAGDRIRIEIKIKNTGSTTKNGIKYLDSISKNVDSLDSETYYTTIEGSGTGKTRPFSFVSNGEYDVMFEGLSIAPGQTLVFQYEVRALPARPGEMTVGFLEGGEVGDDSYGDVGFKGSISCGADMLVWRSLDSSSYERGTRTFLQPEIPASIKSQVIDTDNDNIPNGVENMSTGELLKQYKNVTKTTTSSTRPLLQTSVNGSRIDIGFDGQAVDNINTMMTEMQDGLACGFGGGSCMSFPINWAPLAPGSAPSVFGYPLWELSPKLGQPLFSGLTGVPMYGPWGCFSMPSVFPPSPLGYTTACTTKALSPGGKLGNEDVANVFRIYVTPTLTLGMGAAICFGGPANIAGKIPPSKLFGFIQGGNCIVAAAPMPFCKGDGSDSDGDVRGVSGLGKVTDTWNAASCKIQTQSLGAQTVADREIAKQVVDYIKTPSAAKRTTLYTKISQRPARTITAGPAIRIGGSAAGGPDIGIEIDTSKPFTMGNIIKIKNGRVPAFPDFIMTWVSNQLNELINALFTAPNLIVVLPGVVGANMQFDGNWENFQKKFTDAYSSQGMNNLKAQMGQAYSNTDIVSSFQSSQSTKSGLAGDFKKWQNNALSGDVGKSINTVGSGLSSVRAAYKLIGQLPFISIQKQNIPINVPWILPRELDKYQKSLENYQKEFNDTLDNWCRGKTPEECANSKASLSAGGFMNSIRQNISRIEEYKKFPAKLQKYVTWKQRYMSQVLCNVDTVRQVLGGWIKDNGVRFRKWAELFVLIKAIAESWQPLIDVFRDTSRKCDVCHNQRNSTVDWKLKILSALIPSPPIMKFPRWPDIILDLSDIRLGINISVPDFKFNIKPIRLPSLPNLSLPNAPTLGLTLPSIPVLPPIPKLPDLPDLPSLPKLALPNLPPPPKIPKLFGSIEIAIKAFKLYGTIKCFLNSTFLAPEGEVGDIIAHKTERQGTLSLDFLSIQFPNFTLPSVRELRASTHVNFNIRSDFITEFARQAVKPVNEFTTDFGRGIPKKIGEDVNISNPIPNVNLKPGAEITGTGEYLATLQDMDDLLQAESKILLDTTDFKNHILSELGRAGQTTLQASLQKELKKSELDSDVLTEKLMTSHNKKFDILKAYIQAEYDSTAELQNIIDMMTDEKLGDMTYDRISGPSQLVRSENLSSTDKLLAEYNTLNTTPITEASDTSNGIQNSLTRLSARLDRLALTTPPSTPSSSTTPMEGYAPVFDGVFTLTPLGKQIRLFDAVDGLSSNEHIEVVDIDSDGDKDYLFRLDGRLYIKYSGVSHRSDSKDPKIITSTLKQTDPLPLAPNFFRESISAPKTLNIAFSPSTEDQKEWRMTLYDRYLEWDMIPIGLHSIDETPEYIIDLYADEESQSETTESYTHTPVVRSIVDITDQSSFKLISPKITILKENANFTLSAGRKLYTGDDGATVTVSSGSIILQPFQIYTFSDPITAKITNGMAYAFDSSSESRETYSYNDDFIGMPMVSDMEMKVGDGIFKIRDHTHNIIQVLQKGTQYLLKYLGYVRGNYSVSVPYSNALYSARLKNLDTSGGQVLLSDVTLFTPQVSSDSNAPIIDTPESIKIPLNTAKTLNLSDYISEMNSYSIVFDENITKDENNNGILDDDFTQTGTNITLKNKNLVFASGATIDTSLVLLKITDENGNVSFKDMKVEIYAPVPQIQSITGTGWINGSLDEALIREPVYLYRVRPGSNIDKVSQVPLLTDKDGKFQGGSYFADNGGDIAIKVGTDTAHISSKGAIQIPSGYALEVLGATSTSPLQIVVKDQSGKRVYTQLMIIPESIPILGREEYASGDAIVVTPVGEYTIAKAGLSDPSIPGGVYIIGGDHKSLFAIASDGNIYLMASGLTLQYGESSDGYLSLLVQQSGTPIANVLYKTSFFYTVK